MQTFGFKGRFAKRMRCVVTFACPPTLLLLLTACSPSDLFPDWLRSGEPRSSYALTVPIGATIKAAPLPKIEGPAGRPIVVIDAGHGGHDPGAVSSIDGVREKDATLAIANSIRERLLAGGRVRVALTRNDDRFIVLKDRYEIARRLNAELFISIHADSAPNPEARGATIYTLSEIASDQEAERLAARENRSDFLNGVDLGAETESQIGSILIDLTQRETMDMAVRFAELLHRASADDLLFRPDYHRQASLVVLKAPDMPSVLFETGYMSNAEDAAFLLSSEGRDKIARSTAKAVETYFARRIAER